MKIIDLTQPLFHHMPVYPGDPEVEITQIHTLEKEGWNLRTLALTTHIGTHVNVPSHMTNTGKSLDDISLNSFFGTCVVYTKPSDLKPDQGVIFASQNIDSARAQQIIKAKPKFIALSAKFEFDVDLEKKLLEKNIVSYENLDNCQKLPKNKSFIFYGLPLKIKQSDGSPVRAFATID